MGDLGLIPGLGRSPGEQLTTPVFWPGEYIVHGGCKELDTTEQFLLSLSDNSKINKTTLLYKYVMVVKSQMDLFF